MAFIEHEVRIPSSGVALAGTLTIPEGPGSSACMILAGGSLSDDRNGRMADGLCHRPERDAIRRLAHVLADAGYASIRWDKRGYGSTPKGTQRTNNGDDTDDLMAVIAHARGSLAYSRVAVFGESAGAYFAGLAAKRGAHADAYVFLGALCSTNVRLFAYNYGRLYEYAMRSEKNRRWAENVALFGLAIGKSYQDILYAAHSGDSVFHITYGDHAFDYRLERQREEIEDTPQALFSYIKAPSLILHGELDMNVPPEDAAEAEAIMRRSGNTEVTRIMIPGVDHSFQVAPQDYEMRLRQRHSFESFNNPYSEKFYELLIEWLDKQFQDK